MYFEESILAKKIESKDKTKVRKTSSLKLKEPEIGILLPKLYVLPRGLPSMCHYSPTPHLFISVNTYKFQKFIRKLSWRLRSIGLPVCVSNSITKPQIQQPVCKWSGLEWPKHSILWTIVFFFFSKSWYSKKGHIFV